MTNKKAFLSKEVSEVGHGQRKRIPKWMQNGVHPTSFRTFAIKGRVERWVSAMFVFCYDCPAIPSLKNR